MAFLSRFSKKNRRAAKRRKEEKQAGGHGGGAVQAVPAGATLAAAGAVTPIHERHNFFSPKKLMSPKRLSASSPSPPSSPSHPSRLSPALQVPTSVPVSPPPTPLRDSSSCVVPRSTTTSTLAEQEHTVAPSPSENLVGLLTPQLSRNDLELNQSSKELVRPVPPLRESSSSSPSSRSMFSQQTDLTQVDDGLTDWGLPKVLTAHDEESIFADELDGGLMFPKALETTHAFEPVDEYLSIKSSVDEWFETKEQFVAAAAPRRPRPSARQIRAMKFLVVIYWAVLLQRSGAVLPRYAKTETPEPVSSSKLLLFVPWL